ncbi:TauD/TfdA dioxygenase family protein [Halotalea alkalilenta]|uniref:TauD/TfdA-like domain-containing protein n=1 Tax=Halotalea alkalilenta TaxID=376489 RepID=A0A172YFL3_9GAMM|nr:TauD/TfdA family dioxygenase [Halotalea alkalilenta]ANF58061.1 hypothetical protein A5892_11770 [Halotalea alkalilenta]
MSQTSFSLTPATPIIGAFVEGIDLSAELDQHKYLALREALNRYQVLFFRDQQLSRERHVALGRRFGELHIHPHVVGPEGHPEIMPIAADENSSLDDRAVQRGEKRSVTGDRWHSDVSCDEEPPLGSILYLTKTPPVGGDTLFASAAAAFDALSPAFQRFLEGLTAEHSGESTYRRRQGNKPLLDRSAQGYRNGTDYPRAVHPVVRTHPETGRKILFVNRGFTHAIQELSLDESRDLLELLYRHLERPEFQVRFQWRPNSVAFWDNRSTQHLAIYDYHPHPRYGERVTIKGDRPFLHLHAELSTSHAGA